MAKEAQGRRKGKRVRCENKWCCARDIVGGAVRGVRNAVRSACCCLFCTSKSSKAKGTTGRVTGRRRRRRTNRRAADGVCGKYHLDGYPHLRNQGGPTRGLFAPRKPRRRQPKRRRQRRSPSTPRRAPKPRIKKHQETDDKPSDKSDNEVKDRSLPFTPSPANSTQMSMPSRSVDSADKSKSISTKGSPDSKPNETSPSAEGSNDNEQPDTNVDSPRQESPQEEQEPEEQEIAIIATEDLSNETTDKTTSNVSILKKRRARRPMNRTKNDGKVDFRRPKKRRERTHGESRRRRGQGTNKTSHMMAMDAETEEEAPPQRPKRRRRRTPAERQPTPTVTSGESADDEASDGASSRNHKEKSKSTTWPLFKSTRSPSSSPKANLSPAPSDTGAQNCFEDGCPTANCARHHRKGHCKENSS